MVSRLPWPAVLRSCSRTLSSRLDKGLEQAADQNTEQTRTRQGITEWDFDELPEEVALKHGKISIKAWPALRDCGESVALEVMDNPLQAEKISRQGSVAIGTAARSRAG